MHSLPCRPLLRRFSIGPRPHRGAAVFGALALLAFTFPARPAAAQTLTFDALPAEQGAATAADLTTANAGSRTISDIAFNASANSDWEIIGNQYIAPASADFFAASRSGDYALAGNAYSGADFNGTTYTGLTLSTNRLLTSLFVGFDDNGGGSNDADTLTLTAFGEGGDLAAQTVTLSGPALSLLDTSGVFGSLQGVTGYRFETTAADPLNAAFGRAFVIADDLSFGAPVPEASTTVSLGLLLGGGGLLLLRRRRSAKLP